MTTSRFLSTALASAILLSSTAGFAAHGRLQASEPQNYECVAERHADGVDPIGWCAAQHRQHRCLGFHLPSLSASTHHGALFSLPEQEMRRLLRSALSKPEYERVAYPRGPPQA